MLTRLENRVPPPILVVVVMALMWWSSVGFEVNMFSPKVAVAILLSLAGCLLAVNGVIECYKVKTTVNPVEPHLASKLVTSGVFKITRNPMYLGLIFISLGWGLLLQGYWHYLGPVIAVLYLTRFQIKPEEQALKQLFGDAFKQYKLRVRRWL